MSSEQAPYRIAVIGGGITGLSAAFQLTELRDQTGKSVEITLYEASHRLGGAFGSEQIGDYLIETGADSFITNKPWAVKLCERLGLGGQLVSTNPKYRRSLILHHGRPVETPIGFNLLAPGKIWPMLTTPLLSWSGKFKAAMEYFASPRQSAEDESLAEFVRRHFGQEMLDNIVQPMVGGIYTSDPERLSLAATLPRFVDMEREHGSLIKAMKRANSQEKQEESASGARYGLFATPRHGMQTLLDTLEERLKPQIDIKRECWVENLEFNDAVTVTSSHGQQQFDRVILAQPTYRAAQLLSVSHHELAGKLNEIEYASSAIVVSGHKLSDIDHDLNAFGLVIPHKEQRQIIAVSFLSRKFEERAPEGRVILRTFVGGAMQPEEIQCNDEELLEKVFSELREILGVRGEPDFARIARYDNAMPQYTVGHQDRVARIFELAESIPQIELAGNAYQGVGVPDSVHSGERAARAVWESLFPVSENVA